MSVRHGSHSLAVAVAWLRAKTALPATLTAGEPAGEAPWRPTPSPAALSSTDRHRPASLLAEGCPLPPGTCDACQKTTEPCWTPTASKHPGRRPDGEKPCCRS